jgi:oligopeptidase B
MDKPSRSTASRSSAPGPVAAKRPRRTTHHGVTLTDDYAWMRAKNWQEVVRDPARLDAGIRSHLEAENGHAEAAMRDTRKLQEVLFKEMKGRIKEDDSSVPSPDGPWSYYFSYQQGRQYPLTCRQPRGGGPEEVLLDANVMAKGRTYFDLGDTSHSPDHKLMAYAYDDKGSEYYKVHVRDLATGKDLADEISDTRGDVVWAQDSQTFFWTWLDPNHRPVKVFRHRLGTPQSQDVLVYEESNPSFFVSLGVTQSNAFILISAGDHETSETRLIDAAKPTSRPRLVARRKKGVRYDVEHVPAGAGLSKQDRLILLTNADGAEDFKIVETPLSAPGAENWREIEPHKPGRLILDAVAFTGHLARIEREGGLPRIVIRRWSDGQEHAIAFKEEAYGLGMSAGFEFDTTALRFSYSSMTTPGQVFDYDMASRKRVLRKVEEIPSGHDPEKYVTRRLMAPAADGEEVPVSLLYAKDTKLDGAAPLLLYGYGSYGLAMPAAFSTTRLSLVDRGFVYAIAHVRGGMDKGYGWYKNGKKDKKTNTFSDFVAVGEFLARKKFTSRGRIVAQGGSAGGMLMGAVANQTPDLFLGILAEVPFVDVLNTMLDDTLPLTPLEWPEWGNPIKSSRDFKRMHSYSPYENVAKQAYPHIFALAGLTDPRVTYWEAAKWVARLRALRTNDNLLLLKVNMDAGHRGASGRFDRLKEVALTYAFALKVADKA